MLEATGSLELDWATAESLHEIKPFVWRAVAQQFEKFHEQNLKALIAIMNAVEKMNIPSSFKQKLDDDTEIKSLVETMAHKALDFSTCVDLFHDREEAPSKADIEMLIQAKTVLFKVVSANSAVMYPWFDHMRSSYSKHVLPFTTEKVKHAGTQFMKKQVTVTTAHFETLKTHMHANSSDDSKPWHDGFSGGENEIIEYCTDTLMNVNGGAMSEAIQSAKTAHITLVNGV